MFQLGPGDPERLRQACVRLNDVYEGIEGFLPRRLLFGAKLEIISRWSRRESRITMRYLHRNKEWEFVDPSLHQILKFLKLANLVAIDIDHKHNIFPDERIERLVKNCLDQRTVLVFVGYCPRMTAQLMQLFPNSKYLAVRAKKGTLAKLDMESIKKVSDSLNGLHVRMRTFFSYLPSNSLAWLG